MDSKSILTSKTLWVNLIALIVMIAASFGLDLGIDDGQKGEIAAGVIAVVNVILRLMTKQPVHIVTPKIGDAGNVSIRVAAALSLVAIWGLLLQAIGWKTGATIMAVTSILLVLYGLARRLLDKDFPAIGDGGAIRHRPALALAGIAVVALLLTGCAGAKTKVDDTLASADVQTGIELVCAVYHGIRPGYDDYITTHPIGEKAEHTVAVALDGVDVICTAPYPNSTDTLIAKVTQAAVAMTTAMKEQPAS
jgi:hypothetical protein